MSEQPKNQIIHNGPPKWLREQREAERKNEETKKLTEAELDAERDRILRGLPFGD